MKTHGYAKLLPRIMQNLAAKTPQPKTYKPCKYFRRMCLPPQPDKVCFALDYNLPNATLRQNVTLLVNNATRIIGVTNDMVYTPNPVKYGGKTYQLPNLTLTDILP